MEKPTLVVLNGHPDPKPDRFCAALSRSYADGAHWSGWNTSLINIGQITADKHNSVSVELVEAVKTTCLANRLAIVFPVWLGLPPDCLTYFLRLATSVAPETLARIPARIVATMDMPSLVYRNQTRKDCHGTILPVVTSLAGIATTKHTLIGSVKAITSEQRATWLDQLKAHGQADTMSAAEINETMATRLSA